MIERDMRGALFKNDYRRTADQPLYKGRVTVGGITYRVSAWLETAGENAKNPGTKYLAMQLESQEVVPASAGRRPLQLAPKNNFGRR